MNERMNCNIIVRSFDRMRLWNPDVLVYPIPSFLSITEWNTNSTARSGNSPHCLTSLFTTSITGVQHIQCVFFVSHLSFLWSKLMLLLLLLLCCWNRVAYIGYCVNALILLWRTNVRRIMCEYLPSKKRLIKGELSCLPERNVTGHRNYIRAPD